MPLTTPRDLDLFFHRSTTFYQLSCKTLIHHIGLQSFSAFASHHGRVDVHFSSHTFDLSKQQSHGTYPRSSTRISWLWCSYKVIYLQYYVVVMILCPRTIGSQKERVSLYVGVHLC
ncbi:unnamed protein product [Choristocarpus tenellus]